MPLKLIFKKSKNRINYGNFRVTVISSRRDKSHLCPKGIGGFLIEGMVELNLKILQITIILPMLTKNYCYDIMLYNDGGGREMNFCKKCGAGLEDNQQFCSSCGTKVGSDIGETQECSINNQQSGPQQTYKQESPAHGQAVASLILGICSLFCFGFIAGVLAIIFGAMAKSKGNTEPKATAGIVLGVIGIIAWIVIVVSYM